MGAEEKAVALITASFVMAVAVVVVFVVVVGVVALLLLLESWPVG